MINIVTLFFLFFFPSLPQPQHAARGGDTGSRRDAKVEGDDRPALKQLSLNAELLLLRNAFDSDKPGSDLC